MEYRIAEEYAEIAEKVINSCKELTYLKDADCRIGFLGSAKEKKSKKKKVFGECKRVDSLYKVFCPYDYLIIIYEANITHFTDRQLRILMEHELMHIDYEEDGDGNPVYGIKGHDYEEFERITEKYGARWYWRGKDGDEDRKD